MESQGVRLGKIFGIEISISWSWLIIFGIITWNLASAFSQLHSGWSTTTAVGTAVAASILFFLSVLVHELAHSLVARSRGIPVGGITLFLFGGVSDIQNHPPTPAAEFLMAIVGPLVSLALGIVFILLSGVGITSLQVPLQNPEGFISQLGPWTSLLLWLGPVNLTLAAFNMIPGYPLDGGRVLRSIIWGISKDYKRSTRWATRIGQLIALVLIINGVAMILGAQIPLLGTGFSNGLWVALIGLFLNNAAVTSYQQVVIEDVLSDVTVAPIMRADPPTVSPDIHVSRLVDVYIMGQDEQAFPVLEGEEMVGLVTLDDVRQVPRDRWRNTTVREIMTPRAEVETVELEEEADKAFEKLSRANLRQLPVLQHGALVGMLRRADILKWLRLHSESVVGRRA